MRALPLVLTSLIVAVPGLCQAERLGEEAIRREIIGRTISPCPWAASFR